MAGTCKIEAGATLEPTKLEALQAWIGQQRWFIGKGSEDGPQLARVGGYRFQDPEGEVGIETLLVRDTAAEPPVLYQVPLTYRATPLEGGEHALVGTMEHSVLGTRYVYDAPHDPAYVAELVRTIVEGDTEATPDHGKVDTGAQGSPVDGVGRVDIRSAKVLSGEQSNTSIIVTADDADGAPAPLIVKVFRVLSAGDNPDVTVQTALAEAGSTLVPRPLGSLRGRWTDNGHDVRGHLAFVQEFLPDVRDAWRVALEAASTGTDFTERARALGVATGEVHRTLAEAMETAEATDEDHRTLALSLRSRWVLAAEAHPPLREQEAEVDAILAAARDADWPLLQRIHGDYHLGQVLDVPGRGWVLLDFEGEPLRPLAERTVPDLAVRDVAGMLRSFDYAAGSVAQEDASRSETAAAWAHAAREAFLDGYADATGRDPRHEPEVLRAMELDKALYEVVYEARNRPSWLPIPTGAVERLVAAAKGTTMKDHDAPRTDESADSASETSTPSTPSTAAPSADAAPTGSGSTRREKPTQESDGGDRPSRLLGAVSGVVGAVGAAVASQVGEAARNAAGSAAQEVRSRAAAAMSTDSTASTEARPSTETGASTETSTSTQAAAPARSVTPTGPRPVPVHTDEINRLVHGHHHDPHSVLGPHQGDGVVTVRTFRPRAATVDLVLDGRVVPFQHEHEGVWTATIEADQVPDYRVAVDYGDGFKHTVDDPYRFWPTLGEVDIHLISEGRHEQLWDVLGSHVRSYDGPLGTTRGTSFAVWAPNARTVRVAGDFNTWDSQGHPMRSLGGSGLWELFIPGVEPGTRYKYEILGKDGQWRAKADPMARRTEIPPATASVVDESTYRWSDEAWITERDATQRHEQPMSIYEVHLGSWRLGLSYTELADQLVAYVKDLGFTHVEFLPVAEHPYGPSWGYQVTGYYAPTSRFGSPDEFRHLVDALHQAGVGVILDWVPAHFPKDAFALAKFDGEALYEHPDPRRGDQPDWGTHVFDFGRPQVRNFLVANALYWLEEFHIDGLRVDAVASMLYLDYSRNEGEWLPNQYGGRENLDAVQLLQETNATVYKHHPGAMVIAEESTSWPGVTRPTEIGGLGFGFKWNMGWMHDTLDYVEHEAIYRQYHHGEMTFGMVYAFSENFVLPISHDEVVYGKGSLLRKMPGDRWQQLANLRAYLGFMWAHPGKKLLFMGQEFAQEAEWADAQSLDWWLLDQPWHLAVHQMVKSMNGTYRESPALWQLDTSGEGFRWIDANDAQGNVFSFLRYGKDEGEGRPAVACVSNFSGGPHHQYRIGLPHPGVWREVLNTDATEWAGSGVGNLGQVVAEEIPWHGLPYSAEITVPPLATVWFSAETPVPAEPTAVRRQERPELTSTSASASTSTSTEIGADAASRPELDATPGETQV
ncbi:1,4-alpha-glucan branching protein GlgB [Arsenicicoccus bolidensis]|uniref:1,4-alpha-glucan branching enzyme GlgB n=1 Tax=Arsenicicoccus bolidensis TaxID=229480 RepID=A0ABS9Q711_9MICO|nr:1,4-alpha-glucan branching protein GlgB [Arsenicicoccus bolidensis]MCG7322903.1 1,4-alpha-glucan branching protein GlgB [Arsenicicoccus bolidensis]